MTLFAMITAVAIVGIVVWFILRLVEMGTGYCERMERIKRGYPVEGHGPKKSPEEGRDHFIDYTVPADNQGN